LELDAASLINWEEFGFVSKLSVESDAEAGIDVDTQLLL